MKLTIILSIYTIKHIICIHVYKSNEKIEKKKRGKYNKDKEREKKINFNSLSVSTKVVIICRNLSIYKWNIYKLNG